MPREERTEGDDLGHAASRWSHGGNSSVSHDQSQSHAGWIGHDHGHDILRDHCCCHDLPNGQSRGPSHHEVGEGTDDASAPPGCN